MSSYVSSSDIVFTYTSYVKSNVVTRFSNIKYFVVHFDRFNFSGSSSRLEDNVFTFFHDTSFNSSYRYSTYTSNGVNVLNRNS